MCCCVCVCRFACTAVCIGLYVLLCVCVCVGLYVLLCVCVGLYVLCVCGAQSAAFWSCFSPSTMWEWNGSRSHMSGFMASALIHLAL